jgi:hypothetical protein
MSEMYYLFLSHDLVEERGLLNVHDLADDSNWDRWRQLAETTREASDIVLIHPNAENYSSLFNFVLKDGKAVQHVTNGMAECKLWKSARLINRGTTMKMPIWRITNQGSTMAERLGLLKHLQKYVVKPHFLYVVSEERIV